MSQAGFSYESPAAAFEEFSGFAWSEAEPKPSSEEIATAVTDVECKRSSRLADVWRRVLWTHQTALADENRPGLAAAIERNDVLLRNAQSILSSSDG